MNEKDFEKINIKTEISTWPCTSVPSVSQFEELQILRPNLFKNMNEKDFEKINIKMEIRTWPWTSTPNISQFEELQILGPNLQQIYEGKQF